MHNPFLYQFRRSMQMNLLLTAARLADWYKASYNDYTENDKQRQVCSRRGAPLQFLPEGKKMELQWHMLPSIHSARWNSRGISFALIGFFLIPKWRDHLKLLVTSMQLHGQRHGLQINSMQRIHTIICICCLLIE